MVGVSIFENEISVADDGPGLPYDEKMPDGVSRAEHWLARLHCSATADGHHPHVHLNALGIGLVIVTALSSSVRIVTHRGAHRWHHEFKEGLPVSMPHRIPISGKGTTLSFKPDPKVMQATLPRRAVLRRKLFDSAHLFPGVILRLDAEVFHAPGGLGDYAQFLAAKPETMFGNHEEKSFHVRVERDGVRVEAAAMGSSDRCDWLSWCNGICTVLHGAHVDGFRDALRRAKWTPSVAMVHVVMTEPRYTGPTKHKLHAPPIRKIVRDLLREPLGCISHR
jgi:DNA gyrase/topoisomerase IV subunit B